jgi:hypothetical protein
MAIRALTGQAIKEFLLEVGTGGPYDFYREFREMKPTTSYASVRRYFWILKELGLIEYVREAPSTAGFPRRLYRIVPGREDDPRWEFPQIALFPTSGFGGRGGKRYRKWVEAGKPRERLEQIKKRHKIF